jgi:hypothetical protein
MAFMLYVARCICNCGAAEDLGRGGALVQRFTQCCRCTVGHEDRLGYSKGAALPRIDSQRVCAGLDVRVDDTVQLLEGGQAGRSHPHHKVGVDDVLPAIESTTCSRTCNTTTNTTLTHCSVPLRLRARMYACWWQASMNACVRVHIPLGASALMCGGRRVFGHTSFSPTLSKYPRPKAALS